MIELSRHDLDEAIDRVAAKMVATPGGDGLLERVAARLPERAATPWFLALPVQLTAGVALVLVAFLYARPSREVTSVGTLTVAEGSVVTEPRPIEVSPQLVAAPIPVPRSLIHDPRSPIPDPRSDHERSLAPVEAVAAIELVGIATPSIDVESAAAIEPIVLTDLVLDPKGDE